MEYGLSSPVLLNIQGTRLGISECLHQSRESSSGATLFAPWLAQNRNAEF